MVVLKRTNRTQQFSYFINQIIITAMDWVNPLIKIINKFKFQLFGRNYENLLHLYSQFHRFDPQNQSGLSEHSFNLLLNAGGVFLTSQQIRTIKDNYPHNNGIAYRTFIDDVRRDISQKRVAAIDHVFHQFQSNGSVSISKLLIHLAVQNHPHVRSLSKTKEKTKKDIEEGLKYFSRDQVHLTHEQFTQFCLDINACIPLEREQFYIDLLVQCFGLHDQGVSLDRLLQLQVTIFQRVRQRTEIKKDEGLRSTNAFKFIDLEEKGVIDFQRFVGVLDRIGCKFSDAECKALFYKHSGGSNVLTYQNICGLFFEMGSGVKDNKNPVYELANQKEGSITTPGMTKKLH